jgi:hypothetical protein
MSNGVGLIAQERQRQVEAEGWSAKHDDQHRNEELASAAVFYALPEKYGELLVFWPWDPQYNKKQKHNRVRQLVIAGALIAAEVDRLLRESESFNVLSETTVLAVSEEKDAT